MRACEPTMEDRIRSVLRMFYRMSAGARVTLIVPREGRCRSSVEAGPSAKHRWNAGFSLLEMLIVLTVLGAVLAIAAPSLARSGMSRAPRVAADKFVTAHALARATAVRSGVMAELHIDVTSGRFWVEVDTTGAGNRDTVGFVRDVASDGVQLASTRSLLCFDARGLPYTRKTSAGDLCEAADATLSFTASGQSRPVVITALGKVIR